MLIKRFHIFLTWWAVMLIQICLTIFISIIKTYLIRSTSVTKN
jgi:hypothetical protein